VQGGEGVVEDAKEAVKARKEMQVRIETAMKGGAACFDD
jgi:hypothetical protein